ncbi:hypothetical protein CMV_005760 [Castanea mollissima]|uniref:Pyridine nucleotide-disulphide oxidoreductase N-terminal domain-containing protein n=1 Tax=Castanea mollissima TaxID=60419 RepID=A0A8J4RJ54_9ROSI|nr:hypothetical protein CMV_005760 [Castanea mollissima]
MDDLHTLETRLCITGKWPSCPNHCHIRPLPQAVAMLLHSDSNRDNQQGGFFLLHHPFHGSGTEAYRLVLCATVLHPFSGEALRLFNCRRGFRMEEATFLTKYGSIVYIIHRRDTFKASKIMQQRALTNPKIQVLWNSVVMGAYGDENTNNRVLGGHEPATKYLDGQLELDSGGYVVMIPKFLLPEISRIRSIAAHTAAIYASCAKLKPILFEGWMANGIAPGGQLTTTIEVENFSGFPDGNNGIELIDRCRKQSLRIGTQILTETVNKVDFSTNPFMVFIDSKIVIAKSIIMATGAVAKRLDFLSSGEGPGGFWNRGISACAVLDGVAPIF